VVIETPGSGGASKISEPWTVSQHARWLTKFMEAQDLRPAALIGHSNSGPVALMIAARAPHRAERLVLSGSVGADFSPMLPGLLIRIAVDAVLEWRFALRAVRHLAYNFIRHPRNFLQQLRIALRTDISAVTRHVRVPVLIAWGRRDHVTPVRCARHLFEQMPTSRVHISDKGSHDWLIVRAKEFADALSRFMDESRSAAETAEVVGATSTEPPQHRLENALLHRNPPDVLWGEREGGSHDQTDSRDRSRRLRHR